MGELADQEMKACGRSDLNINKGERHQRGEGREIASRGTTEMRLIERGS